jgi:putative Holliday junction resolvase
MGRILGIDYGTVRIGLALSDPLGMMATPHSVLNAGHPKKVLEDVTSLCMEKEVEKVVLGWPLNMDGTPGRLTESITKFKDQLQECAQIPVVTWDERLTTVTAEQGLIASGAKRKRKKELVDQIAAQILLQHYLDSQDEGGLPLPTRSASATG